MWQDWAISGVQLMLVISLLPTVFHPTQKPSLMSSIMTAGSLYVFAVVYFTLSFWFSMLMAAILAVLWTILGMQRYRLDKKDALTGL